MNKEKIMEQIHFQLIDERIKPRMEVKQAANLSIHKLNKGEKVSFDYTVAPHVVDQVIFESKATGQFDLGLFTIPLLHVKKNE